MCECGQPGVLEVSDSCDRELPIVASYGCSASSKHFSVEIEVFDQVVVECFEFEEDCAHCMYVAAECIALDWRCARRQLIDNCIQCFVPAFDK